MLLCAQIIGAPSVPTAAAVEAATPLLSSDLAEILLLLFAFILISNLIYDIIFFDKPFTIGETVFAVWNDIDAKTLRTQ
jgi:hypothetical protein